MHPPFPGDNCKNDSLLFPLPIYVLDFCFRREVSAPPPLTFSLFKEFGVPNHATHTCPRCRLSGFFGFPPRSSARSPPCKPIRYLAPDCSPHFSLLSILGRDEAPSCFSSIYLPDFPLFSFFLPPIIFLSSNTVCFSPLPVLWRGFVLSLCTHAKTCPLLFSTRLPFFFHFSVGRKCFFAI